MSGLDYQAMLRPVIPWTCSWLEDTEIVAICRLDLDLVFLGFSSWCANPIQSVAWIVETTISRLVWVSSILSLFLIDVGFDRSTIWWHQAPLRMYTRWRAASRCDPKKWSTCSRIFKPSFKPSSYWRLNPIVELQPLKCYVMLCCIPIANPYRIGLHLTTELGRFHITWYPGCLICTSIIQHWCAAQCGCVCKWWMYPHMVLFQGNMLINLNKQSNLGTQFSVKPKSHQRRW